MMPMKTDASSKTTVYALRCYVNGNRKYTDALTQEEAVCFRAAAKHLMAYLTRRYELKEKKP